MYLGIDLGTSAVKVLLMDKEQRILATASSPLDVSRPHSGWAEQNPADWISAVEECFGHIQRACPLSALRGIGLSGQMHGATLLDANGEALRPCILWNDTRSHREAAEMNADDAQFFRITGNTVFPGFAAPKLAWIRRNEPKLFSQIDKVLLPKDFVRLWLTGEYISDVSDSAGTSWLDVEQRQWSDALLSATGLVQQQMPRLVEGTEPAGKLSAELAQKWCGTGQIEVVVAGGAGDNASTACGLGMVRPGSAFISIGTSGVLFTSTADFRPSPATGVHTFCHAIPSSWHQMGVILSATDSLNWLSRITGKTPRELTAELGDELRPPASVTFLPYLSGERTPHNDAQIRGSFVGLAHQTEQTTLTQAVLEGVAFAFRDSLEALRQTGTQLDSLVAVGGGARCTYWLRAIATALDTPIDVPAVECADFAAAMGAARLGMVAAEAVDPLQVCTAPAIETRVEPNRTLVPAYEVAYRRFRALYPALKKATAEF